MKTKILSTPTSPLFINYIFISQKDNCIADGTKMASFLSNHKSYPFIIFNPELHWQKQQFRPKDFKSGSREKEDPDP